MLKVGLVGAGMMGRVHAQAYAGIQGAQLVGVADTQAEAAETLAAASGVRAYRTLEEMVQAENPDIIDICLPTYLHKPVTVEAAALGKHVFCEKPMAPSLEDAQEMIDACRKAGVKLMIGHVLRFSPDYAMVKQLVDENRLGRVGTVRLLRETAMPGWASWFADAGRSGGVLLDLAIHDIDWLRWTFGEAARVYGKSLERGKDMPGEHAFVSIRMKSGTIAHITGSWAQPDGFRAFLEVAGTEGVVTLDSDDTAAVKTSVRTNGQTQHSSASPLKQDAYTAELQHFVDCIVHDREPLVTGEEAYHSLELALAAIRSADSGEVVHLGQGGDVQ